jgi:hypothetical protein
VRRSRTGSIKRATTPPGGGHDTHEHAPRLRPSRSHRLPWCQAAHLAVTQAVVDQREQLAGGGDAADAGAAPAGDAVKVDGLLAACREPLGGLDGGPADQPRALFGDRAAAHGGVGLAVAGRQPSPGAQLRGGGEAADVADLGDEDGGQHRAHPGMAWMAR